MDIQRGLRIPVYGLDCGGAGATTIERELAATDGVVRAHVNPATETAYVDYDPAEAGPEVLIRAIERAGYGAANRTGRARCPSRGGWLTRLIRRASGRRAEQPARGATPSPTQDGRLTRGR